MTKNTTKRNLLTSVVALILCFSMLLGVTWAWFTDSVTITGNKIESGTLKVDLELLDKATGRWNSLKESQAPIWTEDQLWEPGYLDVKIFKVENEGTLALKWVAKFASEEELSALADVIDVYVRPYGVLADGANVAYPSDRNLDGYNKVGTLAQFVNTIEETTYGVLEAGQVAYLGIALKMQENAGNEYQGLSIGGAFDIRIQATQWTGEGESDSFDNQYDKDATFDDFADTTILATETKTLVAGENSVQFDLSNEGLNIAKVTVPADAIADPTKPVTVTFDGIEPQIVGENIQAYAYDINVTNLKSNLTEDQMVTVVVEAPNALAAMQAYHNGVLIEDAVYDEVAGTITFKTASFSPYEFISTVMEVSNLEDLRNAVKESNVEIKLMADLTIDLTAGSADRSADHVLTSGRKTYYNAVNIIGENVAIDLNGHTITVKCSNAYNGNQDVGALFFVSESGSLNIVDRVGNGFIKMASSIYMVWAPYASPSYVDIYSGAFIADSYAGDPIGTSTDPGSADGTMQNENSNRALIYAGTGGNMNIYGGYFLYNNTPNDVLNRNNGAFNCTNGYEGDRPFITIHDGVMLIDKAYRQDPTHTSEFQNILKEHPDAKPTDEGIMDNSSIKLAKYCEVVENVAHSVTIDGKTYNTWCRVTSKQPVSLTTDGSQTIYAVGDTLHLTVKVNYPYHPSETLEVGDYTLSAYDMTIGGKKNITITYTENEKTVSANIWVDVKDDFNAIVVTPKKTTFKTTDTITAEDFIVNAIASDGTRGDISNYEISPIDMSVGTKTVTISYTNKITGKVTSATCTIEVINTTTLSGNNTHNQIAFVPHAFYLGNSTTQYMYCQYTQSRYNNTEMYTSYVGAFPGGANGEKATGFNNMASNVSAGSVVMGDSQYDLTITDALPWTTVGVGCITGFDVPVIGVGYYIDGELDTLKYSRPDYFKELVKIDAGYQGFIDAYGTEGIIANTKFTLSGFEAGSTHTITWVFVFEDGIQHLSDWTVTMKSNFGGESFKDTEKPNVNVIVLSGQSNAAGATVIDQNAINRFANTDYKNVYIQYKNVYTNDGINVFTQSQNAGFEKYAFGIGGFYDTTFGPEAALAYHLATDPTLKDQQWFIIKYTAPGTNLDLHWRQNANLSQKMMDYVEDCVEGLVAEGYDVQIRSLLWMQGENDAIEGAETCANNYAVNEQTLVQNFRIKFAKYATRPNGSVPGSGISFITAGIAPYGKDGLTLWKNSDIVNAAKVNNAGIWYVPGTLTEYSALYGKVAAPGMHLNPNGGAIYNSAYIDTSLMSTQAHDTAHYDQQSMDWLGTWFGQYVSALMTIYG
jgi:predicted ribosomally synthesized peptide with SipW-like signal peptide